MLPLEHSAMLLTSIKGICLSKALTCMKLFLYKQKLLFYQGDGYLWPQCCMDNLYISHRSLYAPTYSFWVICSMPTSLFRVCNIVTRWEPITWTWTTIIWLQYLEVFWPKYYVFLVLFTIFQFDLEKFISKKFKFI